MTTPRFSSQAGLASLRHGRLVILTPDAVQGMVPRDGEAAYRTLDRIVPARQALNLLAAVDDLPPAHDCPGRLRRCDDHPGWRVFRTEYGGEWYAIPPGPETFPTPDEYVHDTWAAAHRQVRAYQLAAIESGEGAGR